MYALSNNRFKPYFESSFEVSVLLAIGFSLTIAVSVAVSFVFQKNKNIKELMVMSVD